MTQKQIISQIKKFNKKTEALNKTKGLSLPIFSTEMKLGEQATGNLNRVYYRELNPTFEEVYN